MSSYSLMQGQVCYDDRPLWAKDGTPLPVAAPERFRSLEFAYPERLPGYTKQRWFTDDVAIYVQAQQGSAVAYIYFYRIDDADIASFQVLNERYARDARRAYYITGKTLRPLRPDAFLPVWAQWQELDAVGNVVCSQVREDKYFATDGCHLYVCGVRMKDVDAASMEFLGGAYWGDQGHVYVNRRKVDADRASFVAIAQTFSPDDRGLWATDRLGPFGRSGERDLRTEQALRDEWAPFFAAHPELSDYWWHRAADAQLTPVTYRGVVLHGLERASFAAIKVPSFFPGLEMGLCGDDNGIHCLHLYSEGRGDIPANGSLTRVSDAPINQVKVISPGYWSDGKTVFLQPNHYETSRPLIKAHQPSFVVMAGGWAKDQARIYYCGVEKKGLDQKRFQVHGCYAWDDRQLFCDGKPLCANTDHDKLKVPHPTFLLTDKSLYCGRRPVSSNRVHLPTLEFLDQDFARDRKQVFLVTDLGLHEVIGADPLQFRVDIPGVGTDGVRNYVAKELRDAWRASRN